MLENFTVPAKLTFWMAEIMTASRETAPGKTSCMGAPFLRRAEQAAHATIWRAVTWISGKHAGKQVFIELVDGDSGGAYAWLAVGRFEPAVVSRRDHTELVDERVRPRRKSRWWCAIIRSNRNSAPPLKMPAARGPGGSRDDLARLECEGAPAASRNLNDVSAPSAVARKSLRARGIEQ
jgi:hypothetical protein